MELDAGKLGHVNPNSKFSHKLMIRVRGDEQHNTATNLMEIIKPSQAATPYRPGKNGFSKHYNTKGSGPADNIYIFYQRLWPGQIANTKYTLTLALGLWSQLWG